MKKLIPLIALGFVGIALAQAPAFEKVDANADGAISKVEAAMIEGLDFAKCDADGNGSLSQDEYAACTSGGDATSDSTSGDSGGSDSGSSN